MNSVVIKVQPMFGSYWNDELEPWVHFIPVEPDLSDLKTQVDFAVSNKHQKQVKQIIYNANAWCRSVSYFLISLVSCNTSYTLTPGPYFCTVENDMGAAHA